MPTIKKIFKWLLLVVFLFLLFPMAPNFKPNIVTKEVLWFILLPLLVSIYGYLLFLSEKKFGSYIDEKSLLGANHQSKSFFQKTYVVAIFFAAITVYGVQGKIGLFIVCFSKQKFTAPAIVKNVYCYRGGRRRSRRRLEVAFYSKEVGSNNIKLSYSICIADPDIKKIQGAHIILYGKNSTIFGKLYEGFIYQNKKYE